MHILIAPNAFKNSLSAEAAAAAILKGLEQSRLQFTAECFPVGDGGDGTGDLLMARLGAHSVSAPARDPFARERMSYFGISPASAPSAMSTSAGPSPTPTTAIIEMANASGLRLLAHQELAPLHASSLGTGDLIRAALDKGADRILIGMGGSATVDGGTGILAALGARFLDARGQDLTHLPIELTKLATIDLSGLDPRLKTVDLTVLCDVDNPLLGPQGAAAVFGPQKGASPRDVEQLETALRHFEAIIHKQLGVTLAGLPKGGTAGGAAAGLYGILKARLVDGIDFFLNVSGFDKALEHAHWVITGEGSLDEQTLKGKGPFGVANAAKKRGLPVIGLAGRLPREKSPALDSYFDVLLPINHEALPLQEALPYTAANLTATARAVGNLLAKADGSAHITSGA
jgi:glycerate 2-kinase